MLDYYEQHIFSSKYSKHYSMHLYLILNLMSLNMLHGREGKFLNSDYDIVETLDTLTQSLFKKLPVCRQPFCRLLIFALAQSQPFIILDLV